LPASRPAPPPPLLPPVPTAPLVHDAIRFHRRRHRRRRLVITDADRDRAAMLLHMGLPYRPRSDDSSYSDGSESDSERLVQRRRLDSPH
jgi:hypothetical protein